ncbi:MAG: enoyl-CoA hydratase/isomerase family protein [Gammaproteobacteria bacterium]|nr:enoyl-CoA hydratase/isomerase family protein [Gammaproteobacteria bacterium]
MATLISKGHYDELWFGLADRHNAFNDEELASLANCLATAKQQPKPLLMRSEGPTFCAGADLHWMRAQGLGDTTSNYNDAKQLADVLEAIDQYPALVIARVQGPAYGGGVGLMACADIALATEDSFAQLSEVKLGIIPATIGPYVQRAIGARHARRYFVTAERISAERAMALGLIHECFADEHALDEGIERLISMLMFNGPEAMIEAKSLARDAHTLSPSQTAERIANRRASEEAIAGISAFLERRSPPWSSQ